jgi:hypothetical protein
MPPFGGIKRDLLTGAAGIQRRDKAPERTNM